MSGFTVQGANDVIEYSSVYDVSRHGILTNTSSSNVTIHGNFIETVGSSCNLDHGVSSRPPGGSPATSSKTRCGYGIQLYSHTHDTIVSENTSVGSRVRAGIVIQTDGSNITVVNNIFANNATSGINYQACGSNCTVDGNITWGNADGGVGGNLAGQVTNNRNVDPLHRPHLPRQRHEPRQRHRPRPVQLLRRFDGVTHMIGANADLGAYER